MRKPSPSYNDISLSLVLLFLLLMPVAGRGQELRRIGLVGGYELGLPIWFNRGGITERCDCEGLGSSTNNSFWGGLQIQAALPFTDPADEHALYGYTVARRAFGHFVSEPYAAGLFFPTLGSAPVERHHSFTVDADITTLEFGFGVKIAVTRELGVDLGAWGATWLSGNIRQIERIESPAGLTFPISGTSQQILADGDQLAEKDSRKGPFLGGSYRFQFWERWSALGTLRARADVDALREGLGGRSLGVSAGVGVFFDLFGISVRDLPPEDSIRPPADVPPVVPVAADTALPRFESTLDIYGFNERGERSETLRVVPKSVRYRQVTPLVPTIYFERNSAALPERYIRLSRAGAARFTPDSLARLGPRALYYQTLNLLGLRLRTEPRTMLTLQGARGADEPEWLAGARAEGVRRYLVEVWGIDTARLMLLPPQASGTGDMARSVTIGSTTSSLLSPLASTWVVRELYAPEIGLKPRFHGGAGIKRWDITIRRKGREIARYSSDGVGGDHELGFGEVPSGEDAGSEPLVAEMIAEDSAGALAAARDRLPLMVDERGGTAGAQREHLLVPIPPSASAESALAGAGEDLRRMVRDGGSITLLYLDEGERARAEDLAGAIAAELRRQGVAIERIGVIHDESGGAVGPDLPEHARVPMMSLLVESGR